MMVPFGAVLIAAWIDSPSLTTTMLVGEGPATERMAPALLLALSLLNPLADAAVERAGAEHEYQAEQSQH